MPKEKLYFAIEVLTVDGVTMLDLFAFGTIHTSYFFHYCVPSSVCSVCVEPCKNGT